MKKKFERVKLEQEKKFAKSIAQGQPEDLITQVLYQIGSEEEDSIPEDLIVLVDMFKNSNFLKKIVLLAVAKYEK